MNEQNSIYQAPASDPSVAPADDLMAAYVGPRYAEYYAPIFERFERGSSASWNWPAFFVTAFWLLYRKMWAMTLVYWFVFPIVLAVFAGAVAATQSEPLAAMIAFNGIYYGLYLIIGFAIVPIFANRLYFRQAKKKIEKIRARSSSEQQTALDVARAGGTSSVIVVIVPIILIALIGIIAAISIPAYQDYTVRAQVSEGLSLSAGAKAAVSEYILDTGNVPADNQTAGLMSPNQISGNYVSSVAVNYGEIVITYGRNANQMLAAKTLMMTPEVVGGNISWSCWSDSIPAKHLPAACR